MIISAEGAWLNRKDARPDIVLLYSAWSGVPSYDGFLPNLQDFVSKLRVLHIPRVIIMAPPPVGPTACRRPRTITFGVNIG